MLGVRHALERWRVRPHRAAWLGRIQRAGQLGRAVRKVSPAKNAIGFAHDRKGEAAAAISRDRAVARTERHGKVTRPWTFAWL